MFANFSRCLCDKTVDLMEERAEVKNKCQMQAVKKILSEFNE